MRIIRRLFGYVLHYWHLLLGALSVVAVVTFLGTVTPQISRWMIDTGIGERRLDLLARWGLLILGLSALRAVLTFVQRYSMEFMSQRVIFDLRNKLYAHLQQLSFGYFDSAQTGQLMSRLTADVETLNRFLGFGIIQLTSNSLLFVIILVNMLIMDWRLTLVSLLFLPFLSHAVMIFARRVRPMFWEIQQRLAEMTATLQENVTGIRVVKAFAREDEEIEKFGKSNWRYLDTNLRAVRLQALIMPYMSFLSNAATAGVLYFGGRQVILGRVTIGTYVAFNAYLVQLIQPVRMLGMLTNLWTRAVASGQRIFEILDTQPEVRDRPDARELPRLTGRVTFEQVDFAYDKVNKVLSGIDLDVRPGEVIAILGGTGSGKSSLINLIPRFYDVTGGRLLIDGHDVRDVKIESLRKQIAFVSQETFLFATSIKDNIAYGRNNATMEQIIAAAKTAQIHDFIASLPQGYETRVGERGVGLSGGQKQRVAIARAILIDAPILILDESTSSVDAETEYRIQKAFDAVMKGRTSFVIAQRLSTVRNADRIIVLDRGRIVEEGTHETLLARGGIYTQIYDLQFRGQEDIAAVASQANGGGQA
ncbi:MAG: ABC transporter ATP-binding protein [Chloroflexota bacterium]